MQTKFNRNNGNIYSNLLNFMKFYGWEIFYDDLSIVLEKDWIEESRQIDVEVDIMSGLKKLREKVINSLEFLSSDQCLNLDTEEIMDNEYVFFSIDEELDDISEEDSLDIHLFLNLNEVLNTFDDLVYLNEAIINFSNWDFLSNNIKQKINDVVNELYDLVLINNPPSYLRLIPLNTIRKQRLENIPSTEEYLFPWYTEFVDVPEEALSIIVEKLANTSLIETHISITDFNWLMYELRADQELYRTLQEKAEIFRLLPTAIEKAYTFRWLTAADNMAGSHRVSEQVSKFGLIGAAIRVTVNTILSNPSINEWRFRAAFCGTGLDDEQRLHLLKPIETALKESSDFGWEGSFNLIEKWLKENNAGGFSDDSLADTLFKGWVADLNVVGEQCFIPLFMESDIYRLLLKAESPHNLAKAIMAFDNLPCDETLKQIADEILKICPQEGPFEAFRNLAQNYFKQEESTLLLPESQIEKNNWIKKLNSYETLIKRESFESKLVLPHENFQLFANHIKSKVNEFVSTLSDRMVDMSSWWEPPLAGIPVHAADTGEHKKPFILRDGEITITCRWQAQRKNKSPFISIKWQTKKIIKDQLWAQFINPDTQTMYAEVFLGHLKYHSGEVLLPKEKINFDPSNEKWKISIIIAQRKK